MFSLISLISLINDISHQVLGRRGQLGDSREFHSLEYLHFVYIFQKNPVPPISRNSLKEKYPVASFHSCTGCGEFRGKLF